jgi:hypothetical protein
LEQHADGTVSEILAAVRFGAFPYLFSILYFLLLYFHFQNFKEKDPKPYQLLFFPILLGKSSYSLSGFIRSGGNGVSLWQREIALAGDFPFR